MKETNDTIPFDPDFDSSNLGESKETGAIQKDAFARIEPKHAFIIGLAGGILAVGTAGFIITFIIIFA